MNNIDKIILGTVQFGLAYGINNLQGKPSIKQSFDIMDEARRLGIKRLDTAEAYGDAIDIIGKYHSDHSPYQILNKFICSEKIDIVEKVEKSLKILKINSFEVYSYHSFKDFETNPESHKILQKLKYQKLIKKIGISIYTNNEFEAVINSEVIDVIQIPFNILDNHYKRGALIEKAKNKGKEIHIRSAFLQGLIFMDERNIPSKLYPLIPYLRSIFDFSRMQQLSIEEVALTYAFFYPNIDGILIGVDNNLQLSRNLTSIRYEHAEAIFNFVNTINVIETELLNPTNWT